MINKIILKYKTLFLYGFIETFGRGLNILLAIAFAIFASFELYAELVILIATEILFLETMLVGQHKYALRYIDKSNIDYILGNCLKNILLNFSIFIFVAILLPKSFFISLFASNIKMSIIILAIAVLLNSFISLNLHALRKVDKVKNYAQLRILFQLTKFTICFSLVFSFKQSIAYSYGLLFAGIISIIIYSFVFKKLSILKLLNNSSINLKYYKFGFPIMLHAMAGILYSYLDRYMLNFFSNPRELSIYSFNLSLGMSPFFIISVMAIYFTPLIYRNNIFNDLSKKYLYKFLLWSLTGSLCLFFVIAFLIYPLISLFLESGYAEGKIYFNLSSIIIILTCFSNYFIYKATAMHRVKFIPIVTLISLFISFIVNYNLIPIYGGLGAISATISSIFCFNLLMFLILNFYEKNN